MIYEGGRLYGKFADYRERHKPALINHREFRLQWGDDLKPEVIFSNVNKTRYCNVSQKTIKGDTFIYFIGKDFKYWAKLFQKEAIVYEGEAKAAELSVDLHFFKNKGEITIYSERKTELLIYILLSIPLVEEDN